MDVLYAMEKETQWKSEQKDIKHSIFFFSDRETAPGTEIHAKAKKNFAIKRVKQMAKNEKKA